jgi:hypothetical protein
LWPSFTVGSNAVGRNGNPVFLGAFRPPYLGLERARDTAIPGNQRSTNRLDQFIAPPVYALFMQLALTSVPMQIVLLMFMRLLEIAFFVGLAGSAVVVIISFIEDFGELLHREK